MYIIDIQIKYNIQELLKDKKDVVITVTPYPAPNKFSNEAGDMVGDTERGYEIHISVEGKNLMLQYFDKQDLKASVTKLWQVSI